MSLAWKKKSQTTLIHSRLSCITHSHLVTDAKCLKKLERDSEKRSRTHLIKLPVNQASSHSFVPLTEKVIDDNFAQ